MNIYLAKTIEGLKPYGPGYDLTMEAEEKVTKYEIAESDFDLMNLYLIDKINFACDSLLDYGDYDYFSPEKCKNMIECINQMDKSMFPPMLTEICNVLTNFALVAIESNTGIAIDLWGVYE